MIIRDYEEHSNYCIRKQLLSELFGSIEEYILLKYLYDKPYHFCKNKYPYTRNLKHMVFWIHPKYKKYWSKQRVVDYINNKYSEKYEINNIFMNDYCNKSVKNIPHYQVYLMHKDSNSFI